MQSTLPEYGVIRPLEMKRHLEPRIVVPMSFAMKARSVTIYAKDIELQLLICFALFCGAHFIIVCKVVLRFQSVDETIIYDY